MRIKTYSGRTTDLIMKQIREELGPDAIILRSYSLNSGKSARVTVAFEGVRSVIPVAPTDLDNRAPRSNERVEAVLSEVRDLCDFHGCTATLTDKLTLVAGDCGAGELGAALSIALDGCFRFVPAGLHDPSPIMLVGPAGAGKTVIAAKIAAEYRLHQGKVKLITTDTLKAAAVDQIRHFANLMHVDISVAATPDDLLLQLDNDLDGGMLIVDTAAVNPHDLSEMNVLGKSTEDTELEPVLVLPAAMDGEECADVCLAFRNIGVSRVIISRMDVCRRVGGMLGAIERTGLKIAGFGASPYIADLLETATATELARRMISTMPRNSNHQPSKKVVSK